MAYRSFRLLTAIMVVGAFFALAGNAFASTQHSTYGQCGSTVYTGTQLLASWNAMGVTNQAATVEASAGFHRMDNSLAVFMKQRVVRANLARSASPEDFGCQPGKLFSVGPRLIPVGTPVMVAIPAQYAKSSISLVPRKGYTRKLAAVHAVGKSNCSNPLRGVVYIYIYVKAKAKTTPKPQPKPRKPTVSCPSGSKKNAAGNCVKVTVSCPSGSTKDSSGNCVTQTQTAAQACSNKGGNWDNNSQLCTIVQTSGNCSNIVVINGSGNTVSVSQQGNCNNVPPPTTTTPSPACNGLNLSASNLSATATLNLSTPTGTSFKSGSLNWGDNTTPTSSTSLSQSHTYAAAGNYTVTATVTFNVGSGTATATCSGSIPVSTPPPPPATLSCSNVTNPENDKGGVNADGETYPGTVDVFGPNGDPLTVSFAAIYGSGSITSSPSFNSNGTDTAHWTYQAPNDAGSVGQSDKITITVHDNKTGATTTCSSQPFVLSTAPSNPS